MVPESTHAIALRLAAPGRGIQRLPPVTYCKVHADLRRAAARAHHADRLAGLDPLAGLLEQAVVVAVQAHVAVAMVQDEQQPEAAQPLRERDAAAVDRPHLGTGRCGDQDAVPGRGGGPELAEPRLELAGGRPRQLTAPLRERA